ncbi:tryptophan dimethylallyltransferase family protein [Streptomyces sp. V3I7]|uniref:tryptophan dimethylallyltransferase family protein n=1 Tax=Streptomyces sp. V3I7 TaxID=3042278 RepID=UPI002789725B|nr:tryptophan dimethylallyltransferase family protein [Streptomyces sp. V3I7]MDQ0994035.1 DMATS type aromatic prenyltransferase [Streptomyces sp. V3I7]
MTPSWSIDRTIGAPSKTQTLGHFTTGQLLRLCDVAGLAREDAETYARVLGAALAPVDRRPLDLPPPFSTFLSDDHTPVEFSLALQPGTAPAVRVLLDPGGGAGGLAHSGPRGLRVVRAMARHWDFATDHLDALEDLFFPPSPAGPLALWCALELRPGGVPKAKVYLNPAASGQTRAAATVREALRRLGHRHAFDALPQADRHLFFSLDLGDWEDPRVKIYLAHHDLSAAEAAGLSRTDGGPGHAEIEAFFRIAAGYDADPADLGAMDGHDPRLGRRPVQSCHSFTETASGLPSGFSLYIPVRDYARHDGEALDRAVVLLRRYGIDPAPLIQSLAAVTSRQLEDGVGLIAYLALAHQQGKPPRVTVYISSEAYAVRPPVAALSPQAEAVH